MILVVGSTGLVGGMVTRQLLAQGKSVRAFVRKAANYQHLADAGAEIVFGDLKEPSTVDKACEGVDIVVTTATSATRPEPDNIKSVDLEGNRNLINAAKKARVEQFVFVSGPGAAPDSPDPFTAAKGKTELSLRQSGIPFTILVPNIFMEVWVGMIIGMPLQMGSPVTLVGHGNRKHSFISVNDVAAYLVAMVGNPDAMNQSILVGGPDAVSWIDIVAVVENVLGQQLSVRKIKPGELIPNLPATVSGLMAFTDTFDSPIDMTETARTFGVRPTTIQEFARATFGRA